MWELLMFVHLAGRPTCRSTVGRGAEPLGRGIPSVLPLKPLLLGRTAGGTAWPARSGAP